MLKYPNVSRLRIFYLGSLGLLGLLLALTVFKPLASGRGYSEIQRAQLLRADDECILQFDIINREGKDTSYNIEVSVDGKPSTLVIFVRDQTAFPYIKRIPRETHPNGGVLNLKVYKDGSETPLEQTTYYLK